jgi:predicted acylesterase/phospholipase RssA
MESLVQQYTVAYEFQAETADLRTWWVWIDASETAISEIDYVEYTLPPAGGDAVRKTDDDDLLFLLELKSIAGTFILPVRIVLKNKQQALLQCALDLNHTQNGKRPLLLSPTEKKIALINSARKVLRGSRDLNAAQLKRMYLKLEHADQFAYAAEVLLVKLKMDEEEGKTLVLGDYQKLSQYIYKDHSLPSSFKFTKALQELQNHDDLSKTNNCESLGLAGSIYKRKWQYDHQFRNLIMARYYYNQGYLNWQQSLQRERMEGDIQNDDGYTAINFAYINEIMAVDKLEEHGDITGLSESVDKRLLESEAVRKFILAQFIRDVDVDTPVLKRDDYQDWVTATVAQAYFGLRKYEQAAIFITRYLPAVEKKPWDKRTFSQQLFYIAYLQEIQRTFFLSHTNTQLQDKLILQRIAGEINTEKIYNCLRLLENNKNTAPATEIKKGGKLGLALSGGGFRASLFHIGALAALAEKDELRNVEMVSCVSGGSIIGAYYYIKLKKLLESKTDSEINKDDYILLVQETEKDFLEGVQKNLRVRIFSNPYCNLKMLFNKNYSRTHRLGELYEKHLYRKIWPDGKGMYMNDLLIKPKGTDESFDIATDNWARRNKVPQLVLNATSVNTGHNWQFTASWMGEPPGNIQADIDVKPRLRRMYYKEAPELYKKFRVGYAVGASSCVPFMFRPMPLYGLYPGIDLQLIDGGLHDNQGIAALIEQECNNMVVSDASGQLPTNKVATGNEAAVFYRADNILQERLRELQFMDLKERNDTAQLDRLVTVHLKNDLQQNPVNWEYCIDPPRTIVYTQEYQQDKELTKYGLLRTIQASLSEIRTDLDSFNDTEAYALMYSGYLQTHYEWNKKNNATAPGKQEERWRFSAIKEFVTVPEKADKIKKILKTGSKLFFKILNLNLAVKISAALLLVVVIILLALVIIINLDTQVTTITIKGLVLTGLLFFAGRIVKGIGFLVSRNAEVKKWFVLIGLTLVGFLASAFYLAILNPLYKNAGKIKK